MTEQEEVSDTIPPRRLARITSYQDAIELARISSPINHELIALADELWRRAKIVGGTK